jgi:hypothetical protein
LFHDPCRIDHAIRQSNTSNRFPFLNPYLNLNLLSQRWPARFQIEIKIGNFFVNYSGQTLETMSFCPR